MRMEHGGRVLGVELRADVPAFVWHLYYLHEVGGGVDAYALHPLCFIRSFIGIVELIAMPVAFADHNRPTTDRSRKGGEWLRVGLKHLTAFHQLAIVCA